MSRAEETGYTFDDGLADAYRQAASGDVANQKYLNDYAISIKEFLVDKLARLGVEPSSMEALEPTDRINHIVFESLHDPGLTTDVRTKLVRVVVRHIVSHWDDLGQRDHFTDLIADMCRHHGGDTNGELFNVACMSYYFQPTNKQAVFSYLSQLNTYSATTHCEDLKKEMAVLSKIGHELGSTDASVYYVKLMADGIGMLRDTNASCNTALAVLKVCELGSENATILLEHIQKLAASDAESLTVIMSLSEIYRHGYGCIVDPALAQECDRVAANLGSLEAFFRLYPSPLSIDELFVMAQKGCHAAYKNIENVAQSTDENDETKRAKHVLAMCKLHGHGTPAQLVIQPAGYGDFSTMAFKAEAREDPRRYLVSSYLSSRHKVGVFSGGYYYLQNQIALNLMLLGVHEKEYTVAPHCKATSSGMYDEIALKTLATYTNGYADSLFGKARTEWRTIAQNLLDACQPLSVESVAQKLAADKPVNTMAGWIGHAISMTFFKVGDKTYLAYGNKGDRVCGNKPSIKFYQIHDTAKLLDQGWLTDLFNGKLTKTYLEMHDTAEEGLGKDFNLELAGVIECDVQNGKNCAVLAVSISARVDLMHADFKREYAKNPARFVLNAEMVSACDNRIKIPKHKPWRFAMRRYAASTLCDVGAKHKSISLPADYHFDLLQTVIGGIYEKYPNKDEISSQKRHVLLTELQIYLKTKGCQFNSTQITELSECMRVMKEIYAPPAAATKMKRSGLFARFRRKPAAVAVSTDNPFIHVARVTDNPLHRVGELDAVSTEPVCV